MTLPSVLLVHNRYRFPGGEERIVEDQIALLRARGHRVDVYEADSGAFEKASRLSTLVSMASVPFSLRHYRGLKRKIRSFGADVVHVHNVFPLLTPAIYWAANACGTPVVQSVHNYRLLCSNGLFLRPDGSLCERCATGRHWNAVRFGCYSGSRWRSLAMAITLAVNRRALRRSPRIFLTPSNFLKEKLVVGGVPRGRVLHFRPGFPARNAVPPKKTEKIILFVGRLSTEKGVDLLVQAAGRLPEWRILIIGGGPEEERLKLVGNGLKNVEFLGLKERGELDAYYERATVLALPSTCYENLPSVILEAWRFGVPAVVSRIGGMAELVVEGETGFCFEPGNADSFVETISKLTIDGCAQMAPGIMRKLENDFGLDSYYRSLLSVYRTVLGGEDRRDKSRV